MQERLQRYREPIQAEWPSLKRVTTWYLLEDWERMFGGLEALLPSHREQFDPENHIQRHHFVHFLYDVLFGAVQLEPHYGVMKQEWNEYWDPMKPNRDAIVRFAKLSANSDRLRTLQKDLFECVERYVQLRGAILPGFALEMVRTRGRIGHPELRLLRDDFAELRDLYISSFETCHHVLRYVVGTANASLRGDHEDFGPGPRREVPRNLDKFDRMPNASKPKWLSEFPTWEELWPFLLDRPMRNAIGHRSVRHDLSSGLLVRDDKPPVKYVDLVCATYRLVYPLLASLNVLKIMRIWSIAADTASDDQA